MRLSVRDTGQGIAPDFVPYVFDRFRQADASASRRHGGLGLGLALVRQIVELHGGAVGVDSRGVQQGIDLLGHAAVGAASGAESTRRPRRRREPVTLKGVSILIVDDETDARELLVAMLEEYGARVRAVDSADAALGILDGNGDGFVPDVLVSDVGMAGTDGFALVREHAQPSVGTQPQAARDRGHGLRESGRSCEGARGGLPEPRPEAGRCERARGGDCQARRRLGRTCAARSNPEACRLTRLGLGVGLPVLQRLRARLDAFEIGIDAVGARRIVGFLRGNFLPPGLLLFLAFLALALALALLLRGSRFVHGPIVDDSSGPLS